MNLEKKYCRANIGKVFRTNEGYDLEVVDGGSRKNYCTIQIKEWVSEVLHQHAQSGEIKYPFHLSILNIACFGEGKYSRSENRMAYNRWRHMLERCYDEDQRQKHPTYVDCVVSDEWLNFQNFARWHERYYPTDGKKYELDKDIRVTGNNVYGKDTCIFITKELNAFMANIFSNNTSGYTGVSRDGKGKKYNATICIDGKNRHLGVSVSAKEASLLYLAERENQSARWRRYYSFDYPKSILSNIT